MVTIVPVTLFTSAAEANHRSNRLAEPAWGLRALSMVTIAPVALFTSAAPMATTAGRVAGNTL